ncbi:MAG: J domain-containing protein [Lentisphaeria bacterium]|nr:J domain-containing protein [Lentisphaeria bacterium]
MVMAAETSVPMLSPLVEELREKLRGLNASYADLVVKLGTIRSTLIPEANANYMVKLGALEQDLFARKLEANRVRREIQLRQAAANHGESLTDEAVLHILDAEFGDWQEELRRGQEKLAAAQKYLAAPFLDEHEVRRHKKLYLALVKKLHPDVNPHLPDVAVELWQAVQNAYERGDHVLLEALADKVAGILGSVDTPAAPDTVGALHAALAQTEKHLAALQANMDTLRTRFPLDILDNLDDAVWVRKRRATLKAEIVDAEEKLRSLCGVLAMLTGAADGG